MNSRVKCQKGRSGWDGLDNCGKVAGLIAEGYNPTSTSAKRWLPMTRNCTAHMKSDDKNLQNEACYKNENANCIRLPVLISTTRSRFSSSKWRWRSGVNSKLYKKTAKRRVKNGWFWWMLSEGEGADNKL